MKNVRSKGAKTERMAANVLSDWYGNGIKFARTPASGGLHWKSAHVHGDIVCTDDGVYMPFVFEVKGHEKIDFSEMLRPDKKGQKIFEFFEQVERDAKEVNKIPILMMRYNGLPKGFFFIGMRLKHYKKLRMVIPKYHPRMIVNNRYVIFTSEWLFKSKAKLFHKKALQTLNYKPKLI